LRHPFRGRTGGITEELAERERDELEEILAEAVDALLDAEEQHKREVRQIAERLSERSST
jgi:coenzyme F420-reducing hydrogenase alpha subunit